MGAVLWKRKRLKNDGAPYVFSPYTLTWNGDCYYMVGWSDKHAKIATFRVDRIYEMPSLLQDATVREAGLSGVHLRCQYARKRPVDH